jgi:hypothetical protein
MTRLDYLPRGDYIWPEKEESTKRLARAVDGRGRVASFVHSKRPAINIALSSLEKGAETLASLSGGCSLS